MNDFFNNINEKLTSYTTPVSKINKAMLDNIGDLIELQSQSFSAYADLGINQAKAALEIRDTESLSAFFQQQNEVAETIQTQFKGDMSKLGDIGNKTVADIKDAIKL